MTSRRIVDVPAVEQRLTDFFARHKKVITDFGGKVNQTFEAFVFAQVINRYEAKKWKVELVAPAGYPKDIVRLKYNTRGRPSKYTYARCERGARKIQIRHGLRVATRHHRKGQSYPANVVLDVAVIKEIDLSSFSTDDFVPNRKLLTFGEAKHMSAFAELVANFIGLVHEMMPGRVKRNSATARSPLHQRPFLYVSGHLNPTAQGLLETIKRRRLAIEIHDHTSKRFFSENVPTIPAPKKPTRVRAGTLAIRAGSVS